MEACDAEKMLEKGDPARGAECRRVARALCATCAVAVALAFAIFATLDARLIRGELSTLRQHVQQLEEACQCGETGWSLTRRRREANADKDKDKDTTEDGVRIHSQSYTSWPVHGQRHSEGLRLYENLLSPNKDPRSGEDWESESDSEGLLPHHRVSSTWTPNEKGDDDPRGPTIGPAFTYLRSRSLNDSPVVTDSSRVLSRRSRVKSTSARQEGDTVVPARNTSPRSSVPPGLQIRTLGGKEDTDMVILPQSSQSSEDLSRPKKGKLRRRRKKHKMLYEDLFSAIHFQGDASNFTVGDPDYAGNGRLRNIHEVHRHWSPAAWIQDGENLQEFPIQEGIVTIQVPGLYLVYAQIHYSDSHDANGYRIYANDDVVAQCVTMAHGRHQGVRSNTCHTSALSRLDVGDRVFVSDIEPFRYAIMSPGQSFFGLLRLTPE
ncbi:unnamed protein product [Darwinula stevensoni]|uniref:THD domain-containing protein n=1 Tax=Darwinula stevensoni TaxID=69355 RepID=A0A7R9A3P3_9CRUS|nr:unnamed protein product [Darwinula stevensoni]CAG0892007.1 unnamed protein product [Darwinula stevensoni]